VTAQAKYNADEADHQKNLASANRQGDVSDVAAQ